MLKRIFFYVNRAIKVQIRIFYFIENLKIFNVCYLLFGSFNSFKYLNNAIAMACLATLGYF